MRRNPHFISRLRVRLLARGGKANLISLRSEDDNRSERLLAYRARLYLKLMCLALKIGGVLQQAALRHLVGHFEGQLTSFGRERSTPLSGLQKFFSTRCQHCSPSWRADSQDHLRRIYGAVNVSI